MQRAAGKSPAMPQTEEEEEADAKDDGQSSSHASVAAASHNGDGGAYGNSAGSLGPTPRSARSNQHSNRSNPGTAQGRRQHNQLQKLNQQQRRQTNEALGHNRRAAHSLPHRPAPGGSGPGSRVSSRPPSVGHLPSGRLPQVVGRGGQRPAASSSAVPPQQRVRRFNASNPSANGQQPAKQPALNGRVTPTLGAMAVGGLQQQRVQALGQAYNQAAARRPPPIDRRQQPGPPQRRSGGPTLMGGPGTASVRRLTPTSGRLPALSAQQLTPQPGALSGQQPGGQQPAVNQQNAVNRTHQRTDQRTS